MMKPKIKSSSDDVQCFLALLNSLEKDGTITITDDDIDRVRHKISRFLSAYRACPYEYQNQTRSDNFISESEPVHIEFPNGECNSVCIEDNEIDTKIDLPLNMNDCDADPLGNYEPNLIACPPVVLTADPLDTTTITCDPNTSLLTPPLLGMLNSNGLKYILVPKPKSISNPIKIQKPKLQKSVEKQQVDSPRQLRSAQPIPTHKYTMAGTMKRNPSRVQECSTSSNLTISKYPKVYGKRPRENSNTKHPTEKVKLVKSTSATISTNLQKNKMIKTEKVEVADKSEDSIISRPANPKVYIKRPVANKPKQIIQTDKDMQKDKTIKNEKDAVADKSEGSSSRPTNPKVYVKRPKVNKPKPVIQTEKDKQKSKLKVRPRPIIVETKEQSTEKSEKPEPCTSILDLDDFSTILSPSPEPIFENPRLPPSDPSIVHVPHPISKAVAQDIQIPRFPFRNRILNLKRKKKCPTCGKSLRMSYLSKHMENHNRIRHVDHHLCSICGKSYTKSTQLARHNQREHSDNPHFRPYLCDQCPKGYYLPSQLSAHMRIHEGIRPYTCQVCKRSFHTKMKLKIHTEIHGERKYKCPSCPRAFRTKRYLLQHSGIHTGIKNYKCEPCGLAFVQIGSLIYHNRKHHPKE